MMVSERFEMRLEEDLLQRVEEWRDEADMGSRAEAIRQLVEVGLRNAKRSDVIQFSPGEKLIIVMLRDLYKHLGITNAEIDPDFVAEAIWGGHSWALKWDMQGLYHDHEDSPTTVREVANFLDMWMFLERGFTELSPADKARLKAELDPFGEKVVFPGFDGNNEGEHYSVARLFIGPMERWSMFKGRDLNSHSQIVPAYRRMYRVFDPMRQHLIGTELSVQQMIDILKARRHL